MLMDALGSPLRLPATGDGPRPGVGDVWVVSADGQDRGLVLVAATREMHVLAWPLTNPSGDAAAPAFTVDIPGMGSMVGWPDAEFGLSMAALDRRLGRVLDDRTMREIRWAVTEGETDAEVSWCPSIESTEAEAGFEAVCWQAWDLGDWAWPSASPGVGVFSQELLEERGLDVEHLAEVWAVKPGRASALVRGVKVPTQEEVDAVLGLLPPGLGPEDVLTPVADDGAQVIALPTYKHDVVTLMGQMGTTEQRARTSLWERSGQAARQVTHAEPSEAAQARVQFALEQLLEETR